jgi:hypothetical protein
MALGPKVRIVSIVQKPNTDSLPNLSMVTINWNKKPMWSQTKVLLAYLHGVDDGEVQEPFKAFLVPAAIRRYVGRSATTADTTSNSFKKYLQDHVVSIDSLTLQMYTNQEKGETYKYLTIEGERPLYFSINVYYYRLYSVLTYYLLPLWVIIISHIADFSEPEF